VDGGCACVACWQRYRQGPQRACFSRRGGWGGGSAVAPEGEGRWVAAAGVPLPWRHKAMACLAGRRGAVGRWKRHGLGGRGVVELAWCQEGQGAGVLTEPSCCCAPPHSSSALSGHTATAIRPAPTQATAQPGHGRGGRGAAAHNCRRQEAETALLLQPGTTGACGCAQACSAATTADDSRQQHNKMHASPAAGSKAA